MSQSAKQALVQATSSAVLRLSRQIELGRRVAAEGEALLLRQVEAALKSNDFAEAVGLARRGADLGYASCENVLGLCYENGWGVGEDWVEANTWYRRAAGKANSEAQFNLGRLYSIGRCGRYGRKASEAELVEAVQWYRLAADQGVPMAQFELRCRYSGGRGVDKDKAAAQHWELRAAEGGHAWAQYFLATRYKYGEGVEADYAEALKWYRRSAAQGHSSGKGGLADYLFQSGPPDDRAEGFRLLLELAEEGDSFYQMRVARLFSEGEGVARDPEQAVEWYRRAAENDVLGGAKSTLGRMYWKGEGVERDPVESRRWFDAAAEGKVETGPTGLAKLCDALDQYSDEPATAITRVKQAAKEGDATALYVLSQCYEYGLGETQDDTEARALLQRAAEAGSSAAQFAVGEDFDCGDEEDPVEAERWYRLAASQGYADAHYALGLLYQRVWLDAEPEDEDSEEGATTSSMRNPDVALKEAAEWFRAAAAIGHAEAAFELAECLDLGRGLQRDRETATEWYKSAAERGHLKSQVALGDRFRLGSGVEKDESEALRWYQQAATSGHVETQVRLASCFWYGKGVKRNTTEAVRWYRLAAGDLTRSHHRGQPRSWARYALGRCYQHGWGVARDAAEAERWYAGAAALGNVHARHAKRRCSMIGWDTEEETQEALDHMQLAAEDGDPEAQYQLGLCHLHEWGWYPSMLRAQRLEVTARWWRRAASQGHADAQYSIGLIYSGDLLFGVWDRSWKDLERAIKCWRIAAGQGHREAECALENAQPSAMV